MRRTLIFSAITTKTFSLGPKVSREPNTMNNIKFSYLYRDAGNYKKWANIVFSNPDGLIAEVVNRTLVDTLSPDGLFNAHQIRVTEAFLFERGNANSDDHCFHEFDSVEATSKSATDAYSRSISQFLAEVAREAQRGWRSFDPHAPSYQRFSTRRRHSPHVTHPERSERSS